MLWLQYVQVSAYKAVDVLSLAFLIPLSPGPSQFWILTSVSATMVTIAMILYSFSEPSTSLDSNIRSEAYSEVSVSVHSNDYDEDKVKCY